MENNILLEIQRIKSLIGSLDNSINVPLINEGRGKLVYELVGSTIGWDKIAKFVDDLLYTYDDDSARIANALGKTNDETLIKSVKAAKNNKLRLKEIIEKIKVKSEAGQEITDLAEKDIEQLLKKIVSTGDETLQPLSKEKISQIKKFVYDDQLEKTLNTTEGKKLIDGVITQIRNRLSKLANDEVLPENVITDFIDIIETAWVKTTKKEMSPELKDALLRKIKSDEDIMKKLEVPKYDNSEIIDKEKLFIDVGEYEGSGILKIRKLMENGPVRRWVYKLQDWAGFDEFRDWMVRSVKTLRKSGNSEMVMTTRIKQIFNSMQKIASDTKLNPKQKRSQLEALNTELKDIVEQQAVINNEITQNNGDVIIQKFLKGVEERLIESKRKGLPGADVLYEFYIKAEGSVTRWDDLEKFFNEIVENRRPVTASGDGSDNFSAGNKEFWSDAIPFIRWWKTEVDAKTVLKKSGDEIRGNQVETLLTKSKRQELFQKIKGSFIPALLAGCKAVWNNALYGLYSNLSSIRSVLTRHGYIKGSLALYIRFWLINTVVIQIIEHIKNELVVWLNMAGVPPAVCAIIANPIDTGAAVVKDWLNFGVSGDYTYTALQIKEAEDDLKAVRNEFWGTLFGNILTEVCNPKNLIPFGQTFLNTIGEVIPGRQAFLEDFRSMIGGDLLPSIIGGISDFIIGRVQGGDLLPNNETFKSMAQKYRNELDELQDKSITDFLPQDINNLMNQVLEKKKKELKDSGQLSDKTYNEIVDLLVITPELTNPVKSTVLENATQESKEVAATNLSSDLNVYLDPNKENNANQRLVGMLIGGNFYPIGKGAFFGRDFVSQFQKKQIVTDNFNFYNQYIYNPKDKKYYGLDKADSLMNGVIADDKNTAALNNIKEKSRNTFELFQQYANIKDATLKNIDVLKTKLNSYVVQNNRLKYKKLIKFAETKITEYEDFLKNEKPKMVELQTQMNSFIDQIKKINSEDAKKELQNLYNIVDEFDSAVKIDNNGHVYLEMLNELNLKSKLLKIIKEMEEGKKFGEDNFKHWKDTFKFKKYDEKTGQLKDVKITSKMDEIMDRIDHFRKKYDEDDSFVRAVIDVFGTGIDVIQYTKGLAHLTEGVIVEGLMGVLANIRESKELVTWTVKHYKDGNWELVKGNFNKKELLNVGKTKRERDERQKESDNPAEGLKKKEQESIMILSRDEKEGLNGLPTKVKQKVKEKLRQGWTTEKPFDFLNTYYSESEINSVFNDKIKIYKLKPSAEFFRTLAKNSSKITVKKGFCKSVKNAKGEYDLSEKEKNTLNHFISKCETKFGV